MCSGREGRRARLPFALFLWHFAGKAAGRPVGGAGLPAISQLHLQPGSHVCALCFRKDGDSEFMNIIANEIGPEVRGA